MSDDAIAASPVDDVYRDPKLPLECRAKQARRQIGSAACGPGNDEGDRPVGVFLRSGWNGQQ